MKATILTAILASLSLAACNQDAGEAKPDATAAAPADAAAPAADAAQTEAVYGDEAPVAIAPEAAAEEDHAHNADGSHAEGEAHEHEEEAGHEHGEDSHTH